MVLLIIDTNEQYEEETLDQDQKSNFRRRGSF